MLWRTLAVLLLMTTGSALWAQSGPSFSCSGRLTPTESIICRFEPLGALDRDLMTVYRALSAATPDAERQALRNDQREWLRRRDRCRVDRRCLINVYEQRIEVLKQRVQVARSPGTLQVRPVEGLELRPLGGLEVPRIEGLELRPADEGLTVLVDPDLQPPQLADPGAGGDGLAPVRVLPDGTIERPEENGWVSLFNPITGQRGARLPDGTMTSYQPLQVQPDELPALPQDYEGWSDSVTNSVENMIGNLLLPEEAQTLAQSSPNDFFDRLDYQLKILAFITGL